MAKSHNIVNAVSAAVGSEQGPAFWSDLPGVYISSSVHSQHAGLGNGVKCNVDARFHVRCYDLKKEIDLNIDCICTLTIP